MRLKPKHRCVFNVPSNPLLLLIAVLCVTPWAFGDEVSVAQPTALTLLASDEVGKAARLVGPDARLQLLVTATFAAGKDQDATHHATYSVEPKGIVKVDAHGLVTPLADGTATITATFAQATATAQVTIEHFSQPPQINFVNQIAPLLTKHGCNGGGCHGKSGGQNGFSLSLLGFEPWLDYERLVNESRGRRLVPTAPDSSLLLLKATNALPHGGGQRIAPGSHDYLLIRRWITQGMPHGNADDPVVTSIVTFPTHRTLARDGSQQIKVLARYSDGSLEDVTHTAQYEPNDKDLALVDEGGHVQMLGLPGDVAVMVRYQVNVGVFGATAPLGAPIGELPAPRNFVDELVFAKLRELGMPPSDLSDDATFIRRATLDITGRLPDPARAAAFLADTSADKRDRLIDELLESTAYADNFTNKWTAILRNKRSTPTHREGNYAFHDWVRQSIVSNKPYNKFVAELLTASGPVAENPPVAWFRQVNQPNEQVEDTAQLFLGVRMQCARCHHHPFEKWSQDDYYGFAAFFEQLGRKGEPAGPNADAYRIYAKRGTAQSKNPSSGKMLPPTALGTAPFQLTVDDDPRQSLVNWMSEANNPFFAKSLVNRYWKHLMGRGLVEPEDDLRETNPPANPKLLNALANHFVASGYDMKDLIRTICRSRVYQLSAVPNAYNATDKQSFSRYYPRRLSAESLLDAIDLLNGTTTSFASLPEGMRASQIPEHGGNDNYFLTVFGRPGGSSACECERTSNASLAQSLHLINSGDVQSKLATGCATEFAKDAQRTDAEKINELYLRAFSRPPLEQELQIALAHLEKHPGEKRHEAFEDILWALINTKEFMFNH